MQLLLIDQVKLTGEEEIFEGGLGTEVCHSIGVYQFASKSLSR